MKTLILRAVCALLLSLSAVGVAPSTCRAEDNPFEGSYTGTAPRGAGTVSFRLDVTDGGGAEGTFPAPNGRSLLLSGTVGMGGQISVGALDMTTGYFALIVGQLTLGAGGAVTGTGNFSEASDADYGSQPRLWTIRRTSAPVTRRVITGRVVNSQGVGVPSVTVTRSGSVEATTTDGTGTYSFRDITPGTYTLTASRPNTTFVPASIRVTMGSVNVTAPSITALFRISGRVSLPDFRGVAGVRITRSGSTASVLTNADGEFSFVGVPSGSVTLNASKVGLTFAPSSAALRITTSNPPVVRFNTSYSVSGRVVNAAGVGVSGVTMSRGSVRVLTNASGNYTFPGLGATTFFVTPSKPGLTFTPSTQRATTTTGNVVLPNFRALTSSTSGS